jgi:hypothetical protein
LEKPILAECAALRGLSNKGNLIALAFQTVSYLSLNMAFSGFFHTPATFGTGIGNEDGGIFLSSLLCLIPRWMEHIMRQTGIFSVKNSGRD